MGYRHGFKSEATSLADEIRAELGLAPLDRLDPFILADHLAIEVVGLSTMLAAHPKIEHLRSVEPEVFSAVTVFDGLRRTIVHNDGHAPVRQHSNVAHELAHGLLLHPATPAMDDKGCRHWNEDIENEANWLAGTLLVTEAMTIAIARGQLTAAEAAHRLAVSMRMIQFRLIHWRRAARRARQGFAARELTLLPVQLQLESRWV